MINKIKNYFLNRKYGNTEIDTGHGFTPSLVAIGEGLVSEKDFYPPQAQETWGIPVIEIGQPMPEGYNLQKVNGPLIKKHCLVYLNSNGEKEFNIISPALQKVNFLEDNLIEVKYGHPERLESIKIKTKNKRLMKKLEELSLTLN